MHLHLDRLETLTWSTCRRFLHLAEDVNNRNYFARRDILLNAS